jgi:lysyl-tRNA synthetase class 2
MSPSHQPDLNTLRYRAESVRRIRDYFHARGVLEVETPTLSRGISLDCHIDVFSTRYHALGYPRPGAGAGEADSGGDGAYFLQTSPEPHMKRLLCHGFPDIYQIGKVFRNGERGVRHNPEFTMLEWYRRDFTLDDLMDEVERVCRLVVGEVPCMRLSYREAFRAAMGADPLELDRDALLALPAMRSQDRLPSADAFPSRIDVLDFIMAHIVEPGFPPGTLTFVAGFPAEQAAQARVHADDPRLAHRFEVYGGGLELGNGYLELADPEEYERRFDGENGKRRARGKPELPKDPALLADLRLGLPPCAGVAMGVDRLVQWGLGLKDIAPTLSFPWEQS